MVSHVTTRLRPVIACVLLAALMGSAARGVRAQGYGPQGGGAAVPADTKTGQLKGVGMDYHPGAQVPLDLTFTDETGQRVPLSEYFDGTHPVILQLGYYKCPMLCGLVSQGMRRVVGEMAWDPGVEYRVLSVSIDPAEQPSLARMKKQTYLNGLNKPTAKDGWHFMVGEQDKIDALTKTVGFRYKWVRSLQQFAHPAGIIILSPRGKITRYLGGVTFDPQTVRLSLVEASDGKVGSYLDQAFLTCLHYNPAAGSYAATAMTLMSIGGAVMLVVMLLVIGGAFWWEYRRRSRNVIHPAAKHAAQG